MSMLSWHPSYIAKYIDYYYDSSGVYGRNDLIIMCIFFVGTSKWHSLQLCAILHLYRYLIRIRCRHFSTLSLKFKVYRQTIKIILLRVNRVFSHTERAVDICTTISSIWLLVRYFLVKYKQLCSFLFDNRLLKIWKVVRNCSCLFRWIRVYYTKSG